MERGFYLLGTFAVLTMNALTSNATDIECTKPNGLYNRPEKRREDLTIIFVDYENKCDRVSAKKPEIDSGEQTEVVKYRCFSSNRDEYEELSIRDEECTFASSSDRKLKKGKVLFTGTPAQAMEFISYQIKTQKSTRTIGHRCQPT